MNPLKNVSPHILCVAALFGAMATSALAAPSFTSTLIFGGSGNPYSTFTPAFPLGSNDLTALGTTDWAIYGSQNALADGGDAGSVPDNYGDVIEVNAKSGGVGLALPTFSNVNRKGILSNNSIGNGVAFSNFSYTDGISPASASSVTASGATAARGGSLTYSNDPGPTFSISVPVSADTNTLYAWFSATKANSLLGVDVFNIKMFDGSTQLGSTLSLNGTTGGDAGTFYILKLDYGSGTTVSGTTRFQIQATGLNQDDAKLTLHAAALSFTAAIPEPSTYAALAGLGVLSLAVFRRRNRVA